MFGPMVRLVVYSLIRPEGIAVMLPFTISEMTLAIAPVPMESISLLRESDANCVLPPKA